MIRRLLLSTAPALVCILFGIIAHSSTVILAGALAAVIIAAATPLATAALRNHRRIGASLGATAGAMAIRLGGFVLISFIFAGTPQMAVLECTIAACLFVNLIIEGVASVRLRNAMADAAGEERLSNG